MAEIDSLKQKWRSQKNSQIEEIGGNGKVGAPRQQNSEASKQGTPNTKQKENS